MELSRIRIQCAHHSQLHRALRRTHVAPSPRRLLLLSLGHTRPRTYILSRNFCVRSILPASKPQDGTEILGESPDEEDEPEVALILIACAIGVATGSSVVVFNDAIHFIRDAIWHRETLLTGRQLLQQYSELELWPRIVVPPILGGLFVGTLGLLLGGYVPELPEPPPAPQPSSVVGPEETSPNQKTDRGCGHLTPGDRVKIISRPVARAIAAAVTLGTGASLGPEGPSVDIGRSWATGLGTFLRSGQRHRSALIAAGSGAGVAAGFNAPIAGVFFAVETILQKQVLRPTRLRAREDDVDNTNEDDASGLTIAMVLLASVVAAVVSQAGLGSSPAFRVPEYRLESLYELPLYLLFGALCGAVSTSFSYSARVASDAFQELRLGPGGAAKSVLLPALGGLTTGVLALGYPEILYQGFDNVSSVLSSNGDYAPGLLLQIVVLKIIATTISRGSGLQGGLYAPSIFIGAALGSAFGLVAHAIGDPSGVLLSAPQAYALVGVAAMLASNCAVPLTSVLLLFELTRDYLIIIPTLGAVGISFWISSLAAPSVRSALATRRRMAAAVAAASAATSKDDMDLLEQLKQRLRAAAILQDSALQGAESEVLSSSKGSLESWSEKKETSGVASGEADSTLGQRGFQGGSTTGVVATTESLTLACAVDNGCLLLLDDMSLEQALALMEEADQTVAVVLHDQGTAAGSVVIGLLSRDVSAAKEIASGMSPDINKGESNGNV